MVPTTLTPLAAFGSDPLAVAGVIAVVGALLLVDLLVFARGRQPTSREAINAVIAHFSRMSLSPSRLRPAIETVRRNAQWFGSHG
ncbi:MAG: hypothetical protein ACKOTA_11560, partial [Solirubrobacterales bacterium]